MGIIETSFESIEVDQLIPSFLEFLFGGGLSMEQGGLWGIALLITVAMVSFLSLKNFSTDRAMVVSALITWITALLSLKAGGINTFIFGLVCIYTVYAIYQLFSERSMGEN